MRNDDWSIVIFIMISILTITLILFYFNMRSEAAKCYQDPMKYQFNKFSENVICTCSAAGINPFILSKDGITPIT
jgi:hypothetical protein